jgi:hypothetical protein
MLWSLLFFCLFFLNMLLPHSQFSTRQFFFRLRSKQGTKLSEWGAPERKNVRYSKSRCSLLNVVGGARSHRAQEENAVTRLMFEWVKRLLHQFKSRWRHFLFCCKLSEWGAPEQKSVRSSLDEYIFFFCLEQNSASGGPQNKKTSVTQKVDVRCWMFLVEHVAPGHRKRMQ